MPTYQPIAVRQSKAFSLGAQNGSLSLAFDAAVEAGSVIVVIGTAVASTDQAALMSTPSGGSATWSAATNTRASGDYLPNVAAAIGENVSAGSPTITVPFTVNGTTVSGGSPATFRFSGVMLEVEKAPASGVVDTGASPKTGTASATSSTSTAATGTLAQSDNLLVLCAGGWFGIPVNPSGWTSRLTQQNGAFIGSQISTLNVTSTATQTGTVAHDVGGATSAILLVLKAAVDDALVYEFEFASSELPSAEGSIEALIARNAEPMAVGVTYEYYSGLTAESGTKAGDSTTRLLRITSGLPSNISVSDTLRGSFRKSGGTTQGSVAWIAGTVKAA